MQQFKEEVEEECGFSPSFSCYSSDHTTTSTAIAKVINEEEAAPFHGDIVGDDFQFSTVLSDEQVSDSRGSRIISSVFNDGVVVDAETEASSFLACSLADLFVDEREEVPCSHSSSESDEIESLGSGSNYCEWRRPKAEGGSGCSRAVVIGKCKKSSSTGGSGTKRWRFRDLLRRSNSEGKQPPAPVMVLTTSKKVDYSNQIKRNSYGDMNHPRAHPVHEQFYMRRRPENEAGKRKSYLPYRKDLVGLFANVNGMGKMLPF